MLSKFKNLIKIYLRKRNFHQIHFESFQKSFEHFKDEDNKTTWNAEIFSKIILDNLKNLENLTIVEIGVARGGTSKYTIEKLDKKIKIILVSIRIKQIMIAKIHFLTTVKITLIIVMLMY